MKQIEDVIIFSTRVKVIQHNNNKSGAKVKRGGEIMGSVVTGVTRGSETHLRTYIHTCVPG